MDNEVLQFLGTMILAKHLEVKSIPQLGYQRSHQQADRVILKNNQETTWGDLHQQQLQPNGHLSTLPSLIQAWCVIPAPRRLFRKRLHQKKSTFLDLWSVQIRYNYVQLCTTMYNLECAHL